MRISVAPGAPSALPALRVGKRVVWDTEKLRAIDLPAADPFIRREYRKGWSL